MKLLPIGHCHQSVAGPCQASLTKKNKQTKKKHALPLLGRPSTRLSKFSGGNPGIQQKKLEAVDAEKAFDSVSLPLLHEALERSETRMPYFHPYCSHCLLHST